MSTWDRPRTIGSTHDDSTADTGDLSSAEREALLGWAHKKGYEVPSIRGVREAAYGTVCLIADQGGQSEGLVVVDGLHVVIGMEGPEAPVLFRELPKDPPRARRP